MRAGTIPVLRLGWRRTAAVWGLGMLAFFPAARGSGADRPPLPEGAKAVLHFDLDRLRESDLYKAMEDNIGLVARSNEKLQMFLEATGLGEATASVRSFTIYSFASPDRPQEFAGIVSGAFGAEAMSRLERAYSPVARTVGGHLIMPVLQTPDIELVMSFLGPGRLSFGTAPSVRSVVTTERNAPALEVAYGRTATLRPVWGLIDAREVIRAVVDGGSGEGDPLQGMRKNLETLQSVGFSVDLGKDLFVELRAFTATPEDARLLADGIKGLVAFAQLGAAHTTDPDILDFFRQIVAESQRDSVYVSFTITAGQMEKLRSNQDVLSGLIPE